VIVIDLKTRKGRARAHVHPAQSARGALVLGHGAGGSLTAPDLVAVTEAATRAGITVALVEQPYRVAGRRSAPPAPRLDEAWLSVVEQLRAGPLDGLELVTGGRSSGARVACRTAAATGAAGVLCLAFPLHPPGRDPDAPPKTRLPELEAVDVPVLIVQGDADRFGMPVAAAGREVVVVPGDHALKRDVGAVAAAATSWLGRVLG
jgi:predicted alpha/beta-hydrolase family hydrolase